MNAYNIDWWGNGYFTVNDEGHICVRPDPLKPDAICDLDTLVRERVRHGQRMPALLAFPQILSSRLRAINSAFDHARKEYHYKGKYFLVFPVKVNQSRRVLDTLTQSGQCVGLEAGSKAELTAVLAHAGRTRTVIICNGYKDREYIRLALNGEKMGHKVFLVIEKMTELRIALEESSRLGIKPRLGVRARLASQGSGKWQASGGECAKFGLDAGQVLRLVEILKEKGLLDCLKLLHFHLGSEMSNIRDIARGVRESARFFVELSRLGCHLGYFDVGGGLGVDYEGTRTQSDCSVNYGLKEYANNVTYEIAQACRDNHLEEPVIITESGRALSAYHAVLVSDVVGVERNCFKFIPRKDGERLPKPLESLYTTWDEMQQGGDVRSLFEWLHDSQNDLQDVHDGYTAGVFTLEQRARSEKLYLCILNEIRKRLDVTSNMSHRVLLEEIQKRMADKLYVNFSLFQSLPDAWGIGQIFPVLPLDGLNKPLTRRAVILDITCDSDGAIKKYVDGDDIETTMPFPEYDPKSPPFIGFFMVGAYQEILGNMHNLFGDTETLEVRVDSGGKVSVSLFDEGSTVADMLRYVLLDPTTLISEFSRQVVNSDLDEATQRQFIDEFRQGLFNYTYLVNEHQP